MKQSESNSPFGGRGATIIIVQARMSSTRFPQKVLKPILGESLLYRQIERIRQIKNQAIIVVATSTEASDDAIAQHCEEKNILCFRGHLTDCLDRHYQVAKAFGADVAIKIPSDCPLIDPRIIDEVIDFYQENKDAYDFVSNLHPATFPDGNDVEIIPMPMLEKAWKEAQKPLEREHTTPYFWENPDQFRIGNMLWDSGLDYSMSHRFTIDYPADYEFIKKVYEELYPKNKTFSLQDILSLLEKNPEIYQLNAQYAGVNWYRNHLNELKTITKEQTAPQPPKGEFVTTKAPQKIASQPSEGEFESTQFSERESQKQQAPPSGAGGLGLLATSLRVREHIIRMSTDGGCFVGASLSATDLVVYLYKEFLNISPDNFQDPNRDYLLLSKGHDVPALYGTFVELGWMEADRLKNHLSTSDHIYWHPNMNIPGIEYYSGSLGHLPAVSLGIAMDIKMRGGKNRVVCITGDGELNEGSCWEAVLVAQAHKVDNLVFVVDRNHFQANMATEDLIPLEDLAAKFEAFGCAVKRIDGHDFEQLHDTFNQIPFQIGKPSVVIADTVRGKGLPSIEARADRWFCNFSASEVEQLLEELHGTATANIESEVLVVR